ncbi:MAG: TIGR02302 family protein [Pseudomonadota bacterium]
MTLKQTNTDEALGRLNRPVLLTHAGLWAERALRAFWPLVAVVLLVLAALMAGLQDVMAVELVWGGIVASAAALISTAILGARRFSAPTRAEAVDRLDRTLPGRPITAIADAQIVGAGDTASERVWEAHVARMAERTKGAGPVAPNLRLAERDPYALRYVALLAFVMAALFGSVWRVASITDVAPGAGSQALAAGPSWEGWVEPPDYTGRPSLYLNDISAETLTVPAGSTITLRFYGEIGALSLNETVSGRVGELPPATDPSQDFTAVQDGRIAIDGPGGQGWDIRILADAPPEIEPVDDLERTVGGEFRQPFLASDDYGVVSGSAEIALDLDAVDRRYGLAVEPEPRAPVTLDLPMTITGDRREFEETLIDDLAQHPFAGLPITLTLLADDAAGQTGTSTPAQAVLPARRFFDPLAAAVIEQRRDLLWSRENAPRVASMLRAISHRPEAVFDSETTYLKLRVVLRRLEAAFTYASVTDGLQEEVAQALWDIAIDIEEGTLSNALERLRRAQDRLSEAIQNGASDEEIAELMQELREAMQDYMQQLAEQAGEDGQNEMAENQEMQELSGDQLEEMLQRLQELMEQGRTEEAQALLDQLRQMMENMQIAQGQQGEGQQGEGQQAMEGLAETLRQQQGLSDEAFRDLQDQFGQNQQGQQGQQGEQGQQQGQQGQQGQQPGQGQGQGQGQPQSPGQGQPGQPGENQGPGNQQGGQQSLADRQQALRQELQRQQQNLPGAGTPEGDAAREALDRAGRAMDGAEEDLRNEDFAGALDNQSEAIEALREGMRELGEAMAQQQGQPGQQGEAVGEANPLGQRDPLGREAGRNGRLGTDEQLLQGDDVYRRARELLDEIRRRSGEQSRPDVELDYLRRLLDRF